MSGQGTHRLLSALLLGTAAGFLGSASCACWIVAIPAAALAVRRAARADGIGGGPALLVGLGTGLVAGLYAASLGTLVFVRTLDGLGEEEAGLASAMLGGAAAGRADAAVGFAALALVLNVFGGVLGGLLGATGASRPAPRRSYRMEPRAPSPPRSVAPPPPSSARPSVPPGSIGLPATPASPATTPAAASPPSSGHDEVPAEAFVSAWRSAAEGGRPRPARPQAPPADPSEGAEEAAGTIVVGAAGEEAGTIAARPAGAPREDDDPGITGP